MNTVLLTAGVVALMAAVIGGDLRAFHIDVPLLKGARVRAALGALGIAFLIAAVLLREDNTDGVGPSQARDGAQAPRDASEGAPDDPQAVPDTSEVPYQIQVARTCEDLRDIGTRNTLGATRPSLNERGSASPRLEYDGETVIAGEREKLTATTRRLLDLRSQLGRNKGIPASLRDKAKPAVSRGRGYVSESQKILRAFARALPPNPTLQEINDAAARLRDRRDRATTQLEDVLTQLAGSRCTLPSTWPAGSNGPDRPR